MYISFNAGLLKKYQHYNREAAQHPLNQGTIVFLLHETILARAFVSNVEHCFFSSLDFKRLKQVCSNIVQVIKAMQHVQTCSFIETNFCGGQKAESHHFFCCVSGAAALYT